MAPKDKRNEFLASYRLLVDFGDAAAPQLLAALIIPLGLPWAMASFGVVGLFGAGLMHRYIPVYAVSPKRRG